jgi:hypothetical protein
MFAKGIIQFTPSSALQFLPMPFELGVDDQGFAFAFKWCSDYRSKLIGYTHLIQMEKILWVKKGRTRRCTESYILRDYFRRREPKF